MLYRVIPCQFNQALPHFVLDFLYMLTICAKICLGNMFQVIASKVQRFLRYTAFSARRLGNIFPHLILVPTSEAYISAMAADVVMNLLGLLTCRYTPRINSRKYHCNLCVETVQWQKPKILRRWIQKWYVWSHLGKKMYAEKLWYDRFWLTYQWTLPTMHFISSRKLFIEIYPFVYPQNQKMAYFQRQKTQCGTMSIFFNIDSSESSYHVLSCFQM